ncbi:hypothetical protein NQ314_008082 [Rhamnusium bicolor]|uniref:DDE Tnp4 domain-containing protein n=1 Tax=Rhamnusium bicolor TaxID=1586634 RepID=A0AAV8YHT6_9CUCU|nr:hypothetical protein NQ314_008082 [Rhamnusium bicolor]
MGERNEPNRIQFFVEQTIFRSTAKEFQSHFRVTLEAFEWLHDRIQPQLQNNNVTGRNSIVPKKQLLAVLWLLATPDSYRIVTNGYAEMAGIWGVRGMIDRTYIPIKAPPVEPQVYVNRKCFHGITLQVVCDHDRRIIDAFTGYLNSVSDVRIFRNSDLYRHISQNPPNYFEENIGDKFYPNNNWCLPPYINGGNLLLWQQNFTGYMLKQDR